MSFTKSKNDTCSLEQQKTSNRSIFDYIVDQSMYVNSNSCFNSTPPFLAYIPKGTATQNIDVENDLRGIMRPYTSCTECKFKPLDANLASNGLSTQQVNLHPHNLQECKPQQNILPSGYLHRLRM